MKIRNLDNFGIESYIVKSTGIIISSVLSVSYSDSNIGFCLPHNNFDDPIVR